jgi:hypothetical protein
MTGLELKVLIRCQEYSFTLTLMLATLMSPILKDHQVHV